MEGASQQCARSSCGARSRGASPLRRAALPAWGAAASPSARLRRRRRCANANVRSGAGQSGTSWLACGAVRHQVRTCSEVAHGGGVHTPAEPRILILKKRTGKPRTTRYNAHNSASTARTEGEQTSCGKYGSVIRLRRTHWPPDRLLIHHHGHKWAHHRPTHDSTYRSTRRTAPPPRTASKHLRHRS